MISSNSDCPCNGCVPPKRKIGCHGTCREFIVWRKKEDEKNAKIYREKKALQDALAISRKNNVVKRAKKEPWVQ